jgi:hypothetical protein
LNFEPKTNQFRFFLIPFLLLAIINLILGLLAGLGRMGWDFPLYEATIHHGALMVGGFLGSLIALEKAVPAKKKIFLLVPALSGGSIIAFLNGQFYGGVILLILASIGLTIVYAYYLLRHYDITMLLLTAGSLAWLIGNLMLLTKRFYPMAFPWWMAFILFTIASERLELSKFLPVTNRHKNLLVSLLASFVLGITLPFHGWGKYISGVALVLISIWLMRYDIIRINIRKSELTRFTGIALLGGYIALLLCGIFLIAFPDVPYAYDAIVHTFFLGFVFSMIFAHGPIIFPGVLGISGKPYHPVIYIPLFLLWSSLMIRIFSDAQILLSHWRLVSGWITATSILFYLVSIVTLLIGSNRHAKVR